MKSIYITTCDYSVTVSLTPPRDTTCPVEEVMVSEEAYDAVLKNIYSMVENDTKDNQVNPAL